MNKKIIFFTLVLAAIITGCRSHSRETVTAGASSTVTADVSASEVSAATTAVEAAVVRADTTVAASSESGRVVLDRDSAGRVTSVSWNRRSDTGSITASASRSAGVSRSSGASSARIVGHENILTQSESETARSVPVMSRAEMWVAVILTGAVAVILLIILIQDIIMPWIRKKSTFTEP